MSEDQGISGTGPYGYGTGGAQEQGEIRKDPD